jgi:hypothetical protein
VENAGIDPETTEDVLTTKPSPRREKEGNMIESLWTMMLEDSEGSTEVEGWLLL